MNRMLKLIKNVDLYAPEPLGRNDILLAADKIAAIGSNLEPVVPGVEIETINGAGKIAVPGFIDSHVHLMGGGGEGSYKTRTPEATLTSLTTAGVTTVVGCLGTDGVTRNMVSLLAKARGLDEEGLTTYIHTGSYRVPVTTITGDVMKDLLV
ncbi:beta-aspartyl-peptidase, partial [bacterium]|nr:beta-aspartyl-peptidase [bacterium]